MKASFKYLPVASLAVCAALQVLLPNSSKHPKASAPFFTYLLAGIGALYIIVLAVSFFRNKTSAALTHKGPFYAGAVLLITALNLITSKFALLPVLYFPSLDRVTGALVSDRSLLLKCLAHSARLLFFGYFGGALIGLATGILIGFSKRASYWITPFIRLIGPIPSTAWIPILLVLFPTAVSASAFVVGLAVWFPVTLMTSSGISNVPQSYFDMGATLGAKRLSQVFKIGVPAAMPHMFLGLFNGSCASFITLITAELIGAKYGIGWYVNWQREMLSYANVYAGLIITACVFFLLVTGLFKLRDRFLAWQKGVIKW